MGRSGNGARNESTPDTSRKERLPVSIATKSDSTGKASAGALVVAILAQLQEDGLPVSALNIKGNNGKLMAIIALPGSKWNDNYSDLIDS